MLKELGNCYLSASNFSLKTIDGSLHVENVKVATNDLNSHSALA